MNRHTVTRITLTVLAAVVVAGLMYGGFWWLTMLVAAP